MVEMILIIARKVIKDEIIERKEVVLNNIREALARIKERDRVDIRVNFADLELTTAHKDEIVKMMESLRKVNIYEDSRVDRGGVIIETDVGAIDARISTQLKDNRRSHKGRKAPIDMIARKIVNPIGLLDKYKQIVHQTDVIRSLGSVLEITGKVVLSKGPDVSLGELCHIEKLHEVRLCSCRSCRLS